MTQEDIIQLIKTDAWMMEKLWIVKSLSLPDWYIGAGFVRSKVWDTLHHYSTRTPLPDLDVIYFKTDDFTKDEIEMETTRSETEYEKKLNILLPNTNWSVTNQARMHKFHNHQPYQSSEEALSHWVETATCIGVRIDDDHNIVLSAPRGIEDLVSLILRPTNLQSDQQLFNERIESKMWIKKWPKLRIVTSKGI